MPGLPGDPFLELIIFGNKVGVRIKIRLRHLLT